MGDDSVFCAGRFDRLEEYLCVPEFVDDNDCCLVVADEAVDPIDLLLVVAFSSGLVSGSMLPPQPAVAPRLSYEFLMAIRLRLSDSVAPLSEFDREAAACCWRRFGSGSRVWLAELQVPGEPVIVYGQVKTRANILSSTSLLENNFSTRASYSAHQFPANQWARYAHAQQHCSLENYRRADYHAQNCKERVHDDCFD